MFFFFLRPAVADAGDARPDAAGYYLISALALLTSFYLSNRLS